MVPQILYFTSRLDWFTAGLYLLAALACGLVAWQARRLFRPPTAAHRLIWLAIGLGMLFYSINEVLDLQTRFIYEARMMAIRLGIYAYGGWFDNLFVLGLGLAGVAILGGLGWLVRREWARYAVVLLGLVILLRFVVVRAALFVGVGIMQIPLLAGGGPFDGILELLGAAVVLIAALVNLFYPSHS